MKPQNNGILSKVSFQVTDLATAHELVYDNLNKVEGVARVAPGSSKNLVEVTFDPSRIDPSQLENSLNQAGFTTNRVDTET